MKGMDVTLLTLLGVGLILAIALPHGTNGAPRGSILVQIRSPKIDGPPVRPTEFKTVEELNQYLARVAKYYKMMGRPRFGKRSYNSDEDLYYSDNNYTEDKYSEPLYASSKYTKLWDLLKEATARLER